MSSWKEADYYYDALKRVQKFIRGWSREGGAAHETFRRLSERAEAPLSATHDFPVWSRLVELRMQARVWSGLVGVNIHAIAIDDEIIQTLMAIRGKLCAP
jgi:hypothetical protein